MITIRIRSVKFSERRKRQCAFPAIQTVEICDGCLYADRIQCDFKGR